MINVILEKKIIIALLYRLISFWDPVDKSFSRCDVAMPSGEGIIGVFYG
jgi:hypothetical protein